MKKLEPHLSQYLRHLPTKNNIQFIEVTLTGGEKFTNVEVINYTDAMIETHKNIVSIKWIKQKK